MRPIEQFERFFTMFRTAWIVALVLSVVQAVVVLYLLILGAFGGIQHSPQRHIPCAVPRAFQGNGDSIR